MTMDEANILIVAIKRMVEQGGLPTDMRLPVAELQVEQIREFLDAGYYRSREDLVNDPLQNAEPAI